MARLPDTVHAAISPSGEDRRQTTFDAAAGPSWHNHDRAVGAGSDGGTHAGCLPVARPRRALNNGTGIPANLYTDVKATVCSRGRARVRTDRTTVRTKAATTTATSEEVLPFSVVGGCVDDPNVSRCRTA